VGRFPGGLGHVVEARAEVARQVRSADRRTSSVASIETGHRHRQSHHERRDGRRLARSTRHHARLSRPRRNGGLDSEAACLARHSGRSSTVSGPSRGTREQRRKTYSRRDRVDEVTASSNGALAATVTYEIAWCAPVHSPSSKVVWGFSDPRRNSATPWTSSRRAGRLLANLDAKGSVRCVCGTDVCISTGDTGGNDDARRGTQRRSRREVGDDVE
jgi:hypothetical protein